jgi:hypothetical protein
MVSERRTAAEWHELVVEWKSSRLTAREYAAWRCVNPRTLTWWKWKLGAELEPAFLEVVVTEETRLPDLIVEVGDLRVRVPTGFDSGELRRLVDALC